ncbi:MULTISPECIES: hypothetical protein [unclassified Streptomyces]|uniref:hypothetical protein n=1 Tax=unclassified Streptomyces TaxID=2593676 RepID=UPI00379497E6
MTTTPEKPRLSGRRQPATDGPVTLGLLAAVLVSRSGRVAHLCSRPTATRPNDLYQADSGARALLVDKSTETVKNAYLYRRLGGGSIAQCVACPTRERLPWDGPGEGEASS